MDASRYTAYEDGYIWKQAFGMEDLKKAFTPAKPGIDSDTLRKMIQVNPELGKYITTKSKYLDMAAADLNQDFLMGVLSDKTKRKYFSGAAVGGIGAGLGALVGGGQGAAIGGLLGALAGFLMDAFDIGLPRAYEALFKARAKGKLKETLEAADAKLKSEGKKSIHAKTAKEVMNMPTETEAQLAAQNGSIKVLVAQARKNGNERDALKLESALATNEKKIQNGISSNQVSKATKAYVDYATQGSHGRQLTEAFKKDIQRVEGIKGKLELQLARETEAGAPESVLEDIRGNIDNVDARLAKIYKGAIKGTPEYIQSWSRMKESLPGFLSLGAEETGKLPPFREAIKHTRSLEDARALEQSYLAAYKKMAQARYGGEPGVTDFPHLLDPNYATSFIPGHQTYAGVPIKGGFDDEALKRIAVENGAQWADSPLSSEYAERVMRNWGNSDPETRKRFMKHFGVKYEKGAPVSEQKDRLMTGIREHAMFGKPGNEGYKRLYQGLERGEWSPDLRKTPTITKEEWNAMLAKKKAEGQALQRMFQGLASAKNPAGQAPQKMVPDLITRREAAKKAPKVAPKVAPKLRPKTRVPVKPAGKHPTQEKPPPPMNKRSNANTDAPRWWEVLEQKHAQEALETARADADVKKKQAEQAQQQASAQNPAVNQSPQQPTATWEALQEAERPVLWWKVLQEDGKPVLRWEVLQKGAAIPQDPNTMSQPPRNAKPQLGMPQQGVDPSAVFNHQAKITEMKAQAALETAKADADVKKKQAEMNLSGHQAGIDMQNKRMEQQNQQVEQAQQQASAQNPAVNQSPQQPTATLQQPTAAGPAMAPAPQQAM